MNGPAEGAKAMNDHLPVPEQASFAEIAQLIADSQGCKSYQAVNQELIDLYWEIGRIISGEDRSGRMG